MRWLRSAYNLNITQETFGDFYNKLMAAPDIDTAAALLKNQLTVAAYIKTANNSKETQDAAQSLARDLGSRFDTLQIDSFYLDILLSYMFPKGFENLSEEQQTEVREAYKKVLASTKNNFEDNKAAFKACGTKYNLAEPKVIINWREHGLTLENIQARTRAFINWIASDINGLAPTSNPNINESIMGYTTVCGDLHAGDFSITAHRQKIHIQQTLAYIKIRCGRK